MILGSVYLGGAYGFTAALAAIATLYARMRTRQLARNRTGRERVMKA